MLASSVQLKRFYASHQDPALLFHDYHRAQEVTSDAYHLLRRHAEIIGAGTEPGEELQRLFTRALVAASWEGVGWHVNVPDHEEEGANIFLRECTDIGLLANELDIVASAIRQTAADKIQTSFEAEVAFDACKAHYGKNNFDRNARRYQYECSHKGYQLPEQARAAKEGIGLSWAEAFLLRLEQHQYRTQAARELWGAGKKANLHQFREEVQGLGRTGRVSQRRMD